MPSLAAPATTTHANDLSAAKHARETTILHDVATGTSLSLDWMLSGRVTIVVLPCPSHSSLLFALTAVCLNVGMLLAFGNSVVS